LAAGTTEGRRDWYFSYEIQTRKRVITFLCDALGYDSLGHWEDCEGNINIEEERLSV